jgi:acetyl-CoA acetyltransferase/uncharacterized OB-fold protein
MLTMGATRRPLPVLDDENRAFWTAGADGVLRFASCNACGALLHPVQPVCRYCRSEDIGERAVQPTGVVIGVSVNHHPWNPTFPTPYVMATVAIDADPRVRVLTNLVDVSEDEVRVGMHVRARFEPLEDVWVPLFAPSGQPDAPLPDDETPPDDHRRWVRPMVGTFKAEEHAAITGVGMSQIGRRLMRSPLSLAVEAVKNAVADAGLELSDIDGITTYPGGSAAGGFSEGGVSALEEALGLRPTWYNGAGELPAPSGMVVNAMLAVASGLCRHVVCMRTMWEATLAANQRAAAPAMAGAPSADEPRPRTSSSNSVYGWFSAANSLGMLASNHFARYGTTRETLGWIALNQRKNAARNPLAIYRDPMTMDDYLSARMISTPLGLYDCDVPCDASVAIVISHIDSANDLRHDPVLFEAVGTQMTERVTWEQSTSTHEPQVFGPAAHLWSRTDLRPSDIDVGMLYDGFTFNCVSWLESLGLCGIGEAKDFLDGGRNIDLHDGVFALNPHGGQLSAGRTHGLGLVHEAVLQLRGEAGERQRRDARVAVTTSGGLSPGGCMLLRRP